MKKLIAITAAVAALSGCAGMADLGDNMAGLGVISESKSSFDGSLVIDMKPTWLYSDASGFMGFPVKLGAVWNSTMADQVGLVLAYNSTVSGSAYINFEGLDINIDGKISSHKVSGLTQHDSSGYNTVSRTIYTESRNVVVIPLAVLKAMLAAQDTRLRIRTMKGDLEASFTTERSAAGQRMAIVQMREFLVRVKETGQDMPKNSQS